MASKKEQLIHNRDVAFNRLEETLKLAKLVENDRSLRTKFRVRCEFLESYYDEFRTNSQKLVAHLDIAELLEAHNKSDRADEAYFTSQAVYQEMFPSAQTTPTPSNGDTNNQINNIKLPKINLPTFDGNLKQWQTFHDMFNTLIHNNSSISNVEKYQYLIGSLSGVPLNIISSLPINNDNYKIAYDLLLKRYQNKRALASEYWRAIQLSPTATGESPEVLQKILDIFENNLAALDALAFNTENWDFILFNLLLEKLDGETKKAFEREYTKIELPTFANLKVFVTEYTAALIRAKKIVPSKSTSSCINQPKFHPKVVKSHTVTSNERKCILCKQFHYLNQCELFIQLTPKERYAKIKELKLCNNCLKGHSIKNCPSKYSCRHCNQRHHSLLHFNTSTLESPAMSNQIERNNESENSLTVLANHTSTSQTLLATAIVKVRDIQGKFHSCRCLLDSGAQSNFITEGFANKLGIPKSPISFVVQGISLSSRNISHKINIEMYSEYMDSQYKLSCLVLPVITSNLPSVSFNIHNLNIPQDIVLADNQFHISGKIDMLIGASLFWEILLPEQRVLGKHKPVLQETKLGWILSGPIAGISLFVSTCHGETNDNNLSDDTLIRFWQVEEPQLNKPVMSIEERECEKQFISTITRDNNNRFVVTIPFNDLISQLGSSKESALRRFFHLENKLSRSPTLHAEYTSFMSEYQSLGHMTEVNSDESFGYYIPHHAIIKNSISTKLRVVFDASMKTSTGISLNSTQMVGPIVQNDLLSIILRFRLHTFVFIGDIKMMYRQILVQTNQRRYQRIFWRSSASEQLKTFELNTVTYGTASAPYLATRCLRQLSSEFQTSHPLASYVIDNDFYVDDLITGSNCLNTLIQIKRDVCMILKSAGFDLRKFMSNEMAVLDDVVTTNIDLQVLNFGEHENCKTLGILWNSNTDLIQFSINNEELLSKKPTKRNILSIVSSIFDPLGLVSPIVVTAKILIQNMWDIKLGWDDCIPENLQIIWDELRSDLQRLNSLYVPRHVVLRNSITVDLHGFCDASEKAYGACIYLRSIDSYNNISVNLLIAKSKVAPLRKLSLPRLELCSASLLANLSQKVVLSIPQLKINKSFYWSDSTIAICWIKGQPNKWKTFVANRVANIQENTNIDNWYHVDTLNNPADIVSRGATTNALINSSFWWHGPSFLQEINCTAPTTNIELSDIPEIRKGATVLTVSNNMECDIFNKFSNYNKLLRVVSYMLRWKTNVHSQEKTIGPLSSREIKHAEKILIKLAQHQSFAQEIHELKNHGQVNNKSKCLSLCPFLDKDYILRVGGRLQNSLLPYDVKHPILLHNKHILTEIIMKYEHSKQMHCGPQNLLFAIRQTFWPINGRNLARKIVRNCIKCFKVKPCHDPLPLMGNLPSVRVTQNSVFDNVGIDYVGPFLVKTHKLRGHKLIKGYIALFICMSTKALHLELVSELTTEAFIATFRRFAARRGKPSAVYSDNGTNFVGANREIQNLKNFLKSKSNQNKIIETFSTDHIQWHFIPSRSPTFGGLWESGVRLVKHHLQRILKTTHVTFEDFYTILVQVEAIVNSRPLTPLSSDPNDLNPLTPGHFLIGKPLTQIPDGQYKEMPQNRLKHYHKLQQITQHLWSRWNKEYINQLQVRQKWKKNYNSLLKMGSLVLIKDENAPPMKWKMGRVIELCPGADKIVRVVVIKTANGTLKRAVSKICVLP